MTRLLFILCCALCFVSCGPETYTPKPRGYARLDTPQHAYQHFDQPGFPYTFEYPVYGVISQDKAKLADVPDNPYWINIDFPALNGTIFLSYKSIDPNQNLMRLLNDAHEMSYFHTKKADFINAPPFHTRHGVHGVMYKVAGDVASAYQFFATDSTKHFLRGALYFNVSPNADSLKPITEFLRSDIEHLLGSLQWR